MKRKDDSPLTVNQLQLSGWDCSASMPASRTTLMTLLEMVERSQIKTGNHAVVVHCMYADLLYCSVLQPSLIQGLATPWMYFLHLSLSSVILTDSSTESPVHVLMLSIQAVRGLPRRRAPGIVPCIISIALPRSTHAVIVHCLYAYNTVSSLQKYVHVYLPER